MASFTLAASGGEEIGGVICSFESKWENDIENNNVTVVFRKKRLAGQAPEWLYVYLGTPVSAITAKMPIEKTEVMTVGDAVKLAKKGAITEEALRRYAKTAEELFVITVGKAIPAKNPVTSDILGEKYRFFPSPNFIRLSQSGADTIDKMAKFEEAR